MVDYCLTSACRRAFVLQHFGESAASVACKGGCDYCQQPLIVQTEVWAAVLHSRYCYPVLFCAVKVLPENPMSIIVLYFWIQ